MTVHSDLCGFIWQYYVLLLHAWLTLILVNNIWCRMILTAMEASADHIITLQNFAKYSTHSGFRGCVSVCLCVCPSVCNNFLVYSITKTILPGSSPHLVTTFLTSIPLFLLLWAHLKDKMAAMPIFVFYFSH